MQKSKRGFSIIELLVIIAILMIIAVIVWIAINPKQRLAAARDARQESDIGQIISAVETYRLLKGTYPSNLPQVTETHTLKTLPNPPSAVSNELGTEYGYKKVTDDFCYICGYMETEEKYYIYDTNKGQYTRSENNLCSEEEPVPTEEPTPTSLPSPIQVSGRVDLQGRTDDSGATVTAGGTYGATTDSLGNYTLTLPAGTYTLKAESNLYLWSQGEFTLEEGTVIPDVKLIGGDITMDGVINQDDSDFIGAHFGTRCGQPNYHANADINKDCRVNIQDASIIGGNFGKTTPTAW